MGRGLHGAGLSGEAAQGGQGFQEAVPAWTCRRGYGLPGLWCAGRDDQHCAHLQVKLLQGLGLQSTLITDGAAPLNLFTTARGLLGLAAPPENSNSPASAL